MLKAEQIRRYFEARLHGQRFGCGPEVKLRCPFHDDRLPSLAVNLEKGVWKCHAGCGEGGVLDFEERFSRCDRETAKANVRELMGEPRLFSRGEKAEAVYQYHDAQGRLVFEKLRFPSKRFVQRRPTAKGYEYRLGDCRKPLYRLPEVLVANEIIVCEGEKDADNVRAALSQVKLPEGARVAVTTNFDGASCWRQEYAPFFAGKKAVVLADNDEAGRKHATQVAASVYAYAAGVKVVNLPGLPEKGDVSNFLAKQPASDLVRVVNETPQWHPPAPEQKLFLAAPKFVSQARDEIDWLVPGVIERGANGVISAVPKGGKSWVAADLAISLALASEWLGFGVLRPVRVALVSREDNPALTAWRIRHLVEGKPAAEPGLLGENLYINTRQQSSELMLDNPEEMAEVLAALKLVRPGFAIFDVFNVLHQADENDAQEMRAVLRQFSRIQSEVGCAIAVVHHWNKADQGSITQRLRGSSAIAGWAEWLVGISTTDEASKTRRMEFELKAAQPPEPIHFRIRSGPGWARLERTDCTPPVRHHVEGGAAESLML